MEFEPFGFSERDKYMFERLTNSTKSIELILIFYFDQSIYRSAANRPLNTTDNILYNRIKF